MKVTKELKAHIERGFDKKRAELKIMRKAELNSMRDSMQDFITNSDEYKNLKDAAKKFDDFIKSNFEKGFVNSSNSVGNIANGSFGNMAYFDNYVPNQINRKYDEMMVELEDEMNILLVKLTYEHDLDAIRPLLKEYNINI